MKNERRWRMGLTARIFVFGIGFFVAKVEFGVAGLGWTGPDLWRVWRVLFGTVEFRALLGLGALLWFRALLGLGAFLGFRAFWTPDWVWRGLVGVRIGLVGVWIGWVGVWIAIAGVWIGFVGVWKGFARVWICFARVWIGFTRVWTGTIR